MTRSLLSLPTSVQVFVLCCIMPKCSGAVHERVVQLQDNHEIISLLAELLQVPEFVRLTLSSATFYREWVLKTLSLKHKWLKILREKREQEEWDQAHRTRRSISPSRRVATSPESIHSWDSEEGMEYTSSPSEPTCHRCSRRISDCHCEGRCENCLCWRCRCFTPPSS